MSRPKSFVTTCSAKRLAESLVLARSFLSYHPEAHVTVVVADAVGELPQVEGITVIPGAELDIADFAVLATAHAGEALALSLAPWVLAGAARPAVWLAGDAMMLAPIDVDAHGCALIVRADAGPEGAIVDPRFAVAVDDRATTVLESWQDEVRGFGSAAPLPKLLAGFDAVALERRKDWGVDPANAEDRGVAENADGLLVMPDGTRVVWVRVGPGVVPGVLLRSRKARDERTLLFSEAEAGFLTTADGTPLDARLRRMFASGVRAGDLAVAPFTSEGWVTFLTWLQAPNPSPDGGGLSRYLFDVWSSRPDLQTAYPDLRDRAVREGLTGLLASQWESGGHPAALRPSGAARISQAGPVGVNVAGYFQSEVGVGEAARRVIAALDAAHVPLMPVQSAASPASRRRERQLSTSLTTAPFDVNLVCVNADGLPRFADEAGPGFFVGRRTIGLWWWELPSFPDRFREAFDHVDEVWVGSRHVQQAIAAVSPVPVVHVPVAVATPRVVPRTRLELGLPEGFLVLFLLDLHSVMERKNPLGLIEAFLRAFGTDPHAHLLIKFVNAEHHPQAAQKLRMAADGRDNVHLRSDYVLAAERDAMLASCDCYVSLHRSEGFGLTLAEAMALGRPTVATGWSGNLEFMDDETGWLVPYELVAVGEGQAPYDADAQWADPDLDAAADAMQRIRADPEAAGARAAIGAQRITERFSPVVAGEAMRARLEALRSQIAQAVESGWEERRSTLAAELATARARASRGPEDFAAGASVPRGALRRAVTRALRPAVANQQATDVAILDAVEAVAARLTEDLEAARSAQASLTASLLAAHRRLELDSRIEAPAKQTLEPPVEQRHGQ